MRESALVGLPSSPFLDLMNDRERLMRCNLFAILMLHCARDARAILKCLSKAR
jgi:hypothetical protein